MRAGKWLCIPLVAVALCSCTLLPVEEEYTSRPTIHSYAGTEYSLGYVQFGDVVCTESVSCKYMAVNKETLAFDVGGELFGGVYVAKGDLVEKGQLLAELDCTAVNQAIADAESTVADMDTQIANLLEKKSLAVQTQTKLYAAADPSARESMQTPDEVAESYDDRLQSLQDRLSIAQLRLEEKYAELDRRQLRAGITGAVTFVRDFEQGERSVEGTSFVSVSDASNSVFYGSTVNYHLLPEGSVIPIYVNKEYLDAEVVYAESLGLEESYDKKGARKIYFRLVEPEAALMESERGTITLTLAESRDTLYIPLDALHEVNGRTFVYQVDDLGLKIMTDVTPGLYANKYVEILSGLQEGDNVIIK